MLNFSEERKWRKWVDDHLVHVLSPNIYRTPSEAFQAFKYFSRVGDWKNIFSTLEHQFVIYVGTAAMYILGKVLKKRYVCFSFILLMVSSTAHLVIQRSRKLFRTIRYIDQHFSNQCWTFLHNVRLSNYE